MAKGRELSAKSVWDVLDVVLRGQQQGVISIESQQGNILEEGEIYVQNQHVTYARTRQSIGRVALQEMLNWGYIRFSFDQQQRSRAITSLRPTSIATTDVQTANQPSGLASRTDGDTRLPVTPPAIPQFTASRGLAQPSERTTPDLPRAGTDILTPGMEWIIPRRQANNRDVLSLPLTRLQRSIYLLVDGHRSIGDLARCTRKSLQEVERLLREMEERSLIAL